jgi:hypothetical protein
MATVPTTLSPSAGPTGTPGGLLPGAKQLAWVLLVSMLLLEGAFRLSGAHRFKHWLDYGYGTEQGLRDLGDGMLAVYSSANRRFWPRQVTASPAPGVRRIVMVGDSVARGSSGDNSWPQQAELALNRRGCRAEIINLSSGGYGSARKLDVTKMALRRLAPQWIVYQASITTEYEDRLDRERRDEAAGQPWRMERFSWAVLWLKERKFDIVYSRWLSPRIRAHARAGSEQVAIAAKTDVDAWYPQVLRNSRQIAGLAQADGVRLIVAPRVSFDRASGRLDDMRLFELAHEVVGADFTFDGLRGVDPAKLPSLFADSAHLTRSGNEWVGEQFAQWALGHGLCG